MRGELVLTSHNRNGSVYFHLLALNGGNGQVVNQSSLLDRREFDGSPSHVERASIFTKMLRSQYSHINSHFLSLIFTQS